MASELEAIFDDFAVELDALLEMATGTGKRGSSGHSPRARIAAGNGATLLLAAIFEEYARQQVKAAFREKARKSTSFSDLPPKIGATVWKKSLESLSRTPFDEIELNPRRARSRTLTVLQFCLDNDVTADIGDALAHNENNMRPSQLNALFNQIGILSICSKSCMDKELIRFLGAGSAGRATPMLESRLNDFFIRRNDIAHAVKLGSSSGPAGLEQDIELFRHFGRALYKAVEKDI